MTTIAYIMNIINGEPFTKYQLDSIYRFANQIIIVEGAYKNFSHAATEGGHSLDSTLQSIRNYPDPKNIIKLISDDGFYDERAEMCNVLLDYVTSDVIWQLDADEFYLPETHNYIKKCFSEDPELDRVSFHFYNFFASLNYRIVGYEARQLHNVNRVHRFHKGDRWLSQRPPTLSTCDGREKVVRKHLDGLDLETKGHVMLHATLMFQEQIFSKFKFYTKKGSVVADPENHIQNIWTRFRDKLNVGGFKNSVTYLKKVDVDIPKELFQLVKDIESDAIKGFTMRDVSDIDEYFSSGSATVYSSIGKQINELLVSGADLGFLAMLGHTLRLTIICIARIDFFTLKFVLKVLFFFILRQLYRRTRGFLNVGRGK